MVIIVPFFEFIITCDRNLTLCISNEAWDFQDSMRRGRSDTYFYFSGFTSSRWWPPQPRSPHALENILHAFLNPCWSIFASMFVVVTALVICVLVAIASLESRSSFVISHSQSFFSLLTNNGVLSFFIRLCASISSFNVYSVFFCGGSFSHFVFWCLVYWTISSFIG